MPWWFRIAAKIALARLPVGYRLWQRLSLFRHGAMDDSGYALRCFQEHYEAAGRPGSEAGFSALELGPGDSLISALIVRAMGGNSCWLVDAGPFARTDTAHYRAMAQDLQRAGVPAPDLARAQSLADILHQCQSRYLTRGLASLREVPTGSVDFIWSQAVLEHVRADEFAETARELRRVQSAHGVSSHRIDLRDHLGGALNNMRFSPKLWESAFMVRSGFYTNRLGYTAIVEAFRAAGFDVTVTQVDRWTRLPTPRSRMAACFRDRPEEDLLVSGFNVVLRPI
tara:strand:+ start:1493 stop:2341 length:849 start_codon:yes stop_codon:yes gene_type:complete